MKNLLQFIDDKFLNKHLDFRVRLFNVLAIAGMLISILMAAWGIIGELGITNITTNIFSAVLSFLLLYYSSKSGQYQVCYIITIVCIFIVLFPILFFYSGGYHSGMPAFFIFAVLFTVFMLEGRLALTMTALELSIYTGICLLAYFFPKMVRPIKSEIKFLIDILVGILTVSISIGITMFMHFRLYNQQQYELEMAKDEAIRFSEAKSNFLANISHEIRTPINIMLGMNEIILRESNSEEIKKYSLNIQSSGKTLLFLINNVLDVSKIEAGKFAVIEETYQTKELIDDLSLIGSELVDNYNIHFQVDVNKNIPNILIGDWIHIKQVIINFLSNATKYTKQGSITLSFDQKPGKYSDEIQLCIGVKDTGIGIKKENIPVLFDAFTRVDLSAHRNIQGTGLGLDIAKKLTELMGGSIHVESIWGKGSTFSVEIMQKISDKCPLGKQHLITQNKNNKRGSFIAPDASLLVVDDNKENIQVIQSLLSRTMLHVDYALSGEECIMAVKNAHYNVILMDYMMPNMDGVETLSHLRKLPGFDTPVIALTANIVVGVKQKLLSSGFCEYLSKPISWTSLETVLLNQLPKELITLNTIYIDNDLLLSKIKDELSKELLNSGIKLDDGLDYLSGDIIQYKKLSRFFIENYESEKNKIIGLAEIKDWKNMKFCVHSLKSKARAVGANNLSATSARLENLCLTDDNAYIEVMLHLLYYEWERAQNGLKAFTIKLETMLPPKRKPEKFFKEFDEILLMIRQNRQPDALEAIDQLIDITNTPEALTQLLKIRQKLDEIELRDAEHLLINFIRGDTYRS